MAQHNFSNILYASDLGDCSRKVFEIAVSEASKHQAELTFLNVVEPVSHNTQNVFNNLIDSEAFRSMRAKGIETIKQLIEARINDVKATYDLTHSPIARVEEGNTTETIINVAQEMNAELIVMGSRTTSHSTLERILLGSTASNVLQISPVPVLIVPIANLE